MRVTLRRVLLAALACAVLAAAAGGVWWAVLAHRTETAVLDWIAARRAQGIDVAYDRLAVGGFPAEITVRAERPAMARSTPGSDLSWRAPSLAAAAPIWRPSDISFTLPGRHQAEIELRSRPPGLRLLASDVAGTLRREPAEAGALWTLRAAAADVGLGPRGGDAPALRAVAARGWARAARAPAPGEPLTIGLELDGLEVPDPAPFGRTVDRLGLTATLRPLPEAGNAAGLAAWRDAGGRLEVHQVAIVWGPLAAEARGQLTLDAQMRPTGSLTARVSGHDAALDALVRSGRMPAGNAAGLKLAGRLLALRSPDGVLELPVRLEDGWAFVGQVRVAPVPPLRF